MAKIYPKLSDAGAIHESLSREVLPFGSELASLMDAVHEVANLNGLQTHYPSDPGNLNETRSYEAVYQNYLSELEKLGFDVPTLLAKANDSYRRFRKSKLNREAKAAKFFELMKSEWIISDDDVRKYIDGDSIYELIELILTHADTTRARMKAIKRHHENRSMKADVFAWLDSNMANFKSMDAAAQAIIKQQPIAFRTARDWVGDWKKLRSASTP